MESNRSRANRYHRLVDKSPGTDVPCRDMVCGPSEPTSSTDKLVPRPPVALGNVAARGAPARGIAGVDRPCALRDHDGVDNGLRLLGSFARFVEERAPMLATELRGLLMQWAARENIPMPKLMDTLRPAAAPKE